LSWNLAPAAWIISWLSRRSSEFLLCSYRCSSYLLITRFGTISSTEISTTRGAETFYLPRATPFFQSMDVYRYKVIAKFGLMHMIATNLCEWLYVLIEETKSDIYHISAKNSLHPQQHDSSSSIESSAGSGVLALFIILPAARTRHFSSGAASENWLFKMRESLFFRRRGRRLVVF